MAKKTVLLKYSVSGDRSFPIDMLRYDAAWPASEADSREIVSSMDVGRTTDRRVVLLHEDRDLKWQPSGARWQSFGWRLGTVERLS